MVGRPDNLPEYENPPVVEVALSVRFKPLSLLKTVHIGLLWARQFRDRFPVVEELSPLSLVQEGFSETTRPAIEILVGVGPTPIPRQWFISQDGSRLIQVQSDGFIHNWRQAAPDQAYPRYEWVREQFLAHLSAFQKFLAEEALGETIPIQCEVTYVNHIEALEGREKPDDIRTISPAWTGRYSDSFLPDPEHVRFDARYVIPNESGDPQGRLYITCQPALRRRDKKPILVLRLIARGKPEGEGVDGVTRFLDRGREWIVRGFTSFTSEEMHRIWRRKA